MNDQVLRVTQRRLYSPLGLWLLLRGISFDWAARVSTLRPFTELEQAVLVWPPTTPLLTWLTRMLAMPWMRWDVHWYVRRLTQGYRFGDGTAQFHPLYPLLASAFSWVGFGPLMSLFLVQTLSTLVLLIVFQRLALLDLGVDVAQFATILIITRPISPILLASYPEALFLVWAVLCLCEARKERWWRAGVAGGVAALTQQQDVPLMLPLAWEYWRAQEQRLRTVAASWRFPSALALTSGGILLWLAYRALALGDVQPDFSSVSAFISSIPISPSANRVVSHQAFVWPWVALGRALQQVWTQPDVDLVVNMVLAFSFLAAVALAWRYMRTSYRIYVVVVALISFSYYTGPVHPYMGLPRHLFLAFSVFSGLAVRIRGPQFGH